MLFAPKDEQPLHPISPITRCLRHKMIKYVSASGHYNQKEDVLKYLTSSSNHHPPSAQSNRIRIPLMPRGPIILSSKDDWQIWLNQIKVFAKSRGVWEYVDPDSATPKTITEPPAPRCSDVRSTAKSLRELNNDELTRWLLLTADHDMAMKRYEQTRGRLGEVHMEIIHTVSKPDQQYLVGQETPRDSLLRLAQEFSNRPMLILEVLKRWVDMASNPPDDNLDNWLGKWYFLYKEAEALKAFEMISVSPLTSFLGAVFNNVSPGFALNYSTASMEESIDFPCLLREFRKYNKRIPVRTYAPETNSDGASDTTSEVPSPNSFENNNAQPKHEVFSTVCWVER